MSLKMLLDNTTITQDHSSFGDQQKNIVGLSISSTG